MKRREKVIYLIVGAAVCIITGAGFFSSWQIYRLTQNSVMLFVWAGLCVLCQTPFVLVPLDRARTLSFVLEGLPQPAALVFIAWNITQLFILILSPVIVFLPSKVHPYADIPFFMVLAVLIIVFRSANRVVEKKITIPLENLSPDFKPLTVLHLSDVHSGPFMRYKQLQKVVNRVNQKTFDLCVVTGDVVNHSAKEFVWTLQLLEKIKSPLGTFATMGNHEYIDDEKEIIGGYKKSPVELLLDSSKFIESGNRKIRLIGVDFPFDKKMTGQDEIHRALKNSLVDSPKTTEEIQILLSHHPNGFNVAKDLGIPVTLSGHTHGGQIEILKRSIVGAFNQYIRGLYSSGNSFLYVNSGLGNWMPFRINVPCEYALITIEAVKPT